MKRGGSAARPLGTGAAARDSGDDRRRRPDDADETSRVDALCDRVRRLARTAGEEALAAKRQQAQTLVERSKAMVEAECRDRIQHARRQGENWGQQRVQAARLAARAKIANQRWSELTAALDQAQRQAERLRSDDPERYAASLLAFFHAAAEQLGADTLVVRAHAQDLPLLRERLRTSGRPIEFVEDQIAAGLIVTTADGTRVCDHSMARRRQRHEEQLRLAATEILFAHEPVREPSGGGDA